MDLKDFHHWDNRWWFRLGPEKEGESWMGILEEFKAGIPRIQRFYLPNMNHLWGVLETPENRATLIDLFDNARLCIEIVENSPRLPGFGEEER
jgi:hypothetical protein